ncbi:MAG: DUF1735 domain-containing protein [Bacteroidales bacterium]|nr:DUF1735 domain-containing protein [Bacteroidales bacterium]
MKKTISYMLMTALAALALSCQKNGGESGKIEPTMKGVFYADIPGDKALVEIAPGASKTYALKACAFRDYVTDITMNFSFKANPEAVTSYNEANGTSYEMAPGTSFELVTNEVMLPRYAKASTTAKLKLNASGLEKDVTYILPLTLDKAKQTDNWAVADTLAAFVLFKLSDYDPYGPGTESNPYSIASVDDLKGMGAKLIEGSKVYFKLDADIDMAGVTEWTPACVGSPYKAFELDGAGHTISNFKGTTSLFGCVAGKIYDLNVTGVVIENVSGPVGILASYGGEEGNPVTVDHVHVQGKITNTQSHGTGGLFGVISEATINACSADIVIVSNKYDSGGIYGYDNSPAGKRSMITNCWTSGDITGNRMVGGIAGMLSNKESECVISCCYSTAAVHAQFQYGGLVGNAIKGDKSGNATTVINNHIEKSLAWNQAVYSDVADDAVHYSAGAIVGFTALKNYHVDCYRRFDLDFRECPGNASNVLVDHANSSPDSPLVEMAESAGASNYNFPYHGKAAAEGETASQVAKKLGWDEEIWDLSGALPFFKGGDAPVVVDDENAGGQLPDFDEHDFFNN